MESTDKLEKFFWVSVCYHDDWSHKLSTLEVAKALKRQVRCYVVDKLKWATSNKFGEKDNIEVVDGGMVLKVPIEEPSDANLTDEDIFEALNEKALEAIDKVLAKRSPANFQLSLDQATSFL